MSSIIRENPLGLKVIEFWPLNGTEGAVVGGGAVTLDGGGSYVSDGAGGQCLRGDGTDGAASLSLVAGTGKSKVTLLFDAAWDAFSDNNAMLMELTTNATSGGGGRFYIQPNAAAATIGTASHPAGLRIANRVDTGDQDVVTVARPSAAAFHRYAVAFNPYDASVDPDVYIDGVLQTQTGTTPSTYSGYSHTFAETLYLFSRAGSSLFGAGKIKNLTLFDGILTQDEITSLQTDPNQYWSTAAPVAPTVTITSQTLVGQKLVISGTTTQVPGSGKLNITAGGTPNGAVAVVDKALTLSPGSFTVMVEPIHSGNYVAPVISVTSAGGTATATGTAFSVAPPAIPKVGLEDMQYKGGGVVKFQGYVSGYPSTLEITLNPHPTAPIGATTKVQSFNVVGLKYFDFDMTGVVDGRYAKPTLKVTNETGSGFAYDTWGFRALANGSLAPGQTYIEPEAWNPPAFSSPSIAVGETVAGIEVVSTSGTTQTNVPVKIGHVFKKGQLAFTDLLEGVAAGETNIPIQVTAKAKHADGSLRHAILTFVIPSLPAGGRIINLQKVASSTTNNTPLDHTALIAAGFSASASYVIGGTTYTATVTAADFTAAAPAQQRWIGGSIANEWILNLVPKNGATPHADLNSQFSICAFAGSNKAKVDVVTERVTAFNAGGRSPTADLTYNSTITVGGTVVDTQTAFKHPPYTRWIKRAWYGTAPAVFVKYDLDYLIDSKAVPNYDRTITINELELNGYATNHGGSVAFGPMKKGVIPGQMGAVGGRSELGLLPTWTANWIVSQDKRAFDYMLRHGDTWGSWPVHMRSPYHGHALSCVDHPYLGETVNPYTGLAERNPVYASDVQNTASPLYAAPDTSHQASMVYVPYLVTGDYFYLEELQMWAAGNGEQAAYRLWDRMVAKTHQIRGMAWTIRTFGQAAYITPDDHPLKTHFLHFTEHNLKFARTLFTRVETEYVHPLGFFSYGQYFGAYNINGYSDGRGVSMWMDDFYTMTMGHLTEMGFSGALEILKYKAKMPVGRLTAGTDLCYIFSASGVNSGGTLIAINGPKGSNIWANTWKEVADMSIPEPLLTTSRTHGCTSAQTHSATLTALAGANSNLMTGEINSYYGNGPFSYAQIGQPAVAYAVDAGIAGADDAWDVYDAAPTGADLSYGVHFAIVPRNELLAGPPVAKFTVNAELQLLLNAATNLTEWATILKAALGSTRRMRGFRNGVEFRNCAVGGDFTVADNALFLTCELSGDTVKGAADMSTGTSVLRIEGSGHVVTCSIGRADTVFVVPGDFTPNNGMAISPTVALRGPASLPAV